MKTHIVLATHGTLAIGMKNSAELIMGTLDNLEALCCYVDNKVNYQQAIKNIVSTFNYNDEQLLIITDLMGGSVNNEFMKYMENYPFLLITGMHLALVLELVNASDDLNYTKILSIISATSKYTVLCNSIVENYKNADLSANDF